MAGSARAGLGLWGTSPRRGIRQSALIERSGISKQAVQQLLDGLEVEGVIERIPDEQDRRGKHVRYTERGLAALRDGEHIKSAIEHRYRERLGNERFDALMEALRMLADGAETGMLTDVESEGATSE